VSINNVDQRPSQLLSTLMLHGYARVSTIEQNPDAQHDALVRAGVHPDQIYVDRTSGAKSSRPCGCRIGHPQEVTWAFSWISPAEPVVHRRPRPGGDAAMITGLWGGRVVASAGAR